VRRLLRGLLGARLGAGLGASLGAPSLQSILSMTWGWRSGQISVFLALTN